jgi:SAM-dependent methyltransferase
VTASSIPSALADDARQRFEALYERLPQWEIDAPQPALTELWDLGLVRGTLLDAGCGSGENTLFFAARGLPAWGIDIAPTAIGLARAKATARGLSSSRFLLGDALELEALGMTFDTVIDSGLLHALTDDEQRRYVASLARVLRPGGTCHILAFSDAEPGDDGPRRVTRAELLAAFSRGFEVVRVDLARFLTRIHPGGAAAWRATFRRAPAPAV